jgi:adenosine deaminase
MTTITTTTISTTTIDWAKLPKVELHCHIEGTMRPSTLSELAKANNITLPVSDPGDLYAYDNLTGFLSVFWLVQSVLCRPQDWERLAYESIIDGAKHGLVYREAFFTPARHLAAGQRLDVIIAALDRGLAAAEADTGVQCALILDFDRAFGPAAATEQAIRLAQLRHSRLPSADRVIGVGMDSTELGIDPATFVDAYTLAAQTGLRRTAHQGENSPASAIATAVDVLGCERIDHGISIFEDADLVSRFVDQQIPLTVCPNANVRINPDVCPSLTDHVFPRMRAEGLLATLNTDDPSLTNLDLTQEYSNVADAYGYHVNDMIDITLDGITASWLDPSDQQILRILVADAVTTEGWAQ